MLLLRNLQYLTALARERHFAKAAAACEVTQPTLSAGIRQLEEQLGLLIVQRGQRFEGFTGQGERILAWARRITADAVGLEQEASRLREALVGQLRIGVVPTALPSVPGLASALAHRHPGIRLVVQSISSIEIQRGLDEFALDAGITYLDNEPLSRVQTIPLYPERYLLLTPTAGSLGHRTEASWREAAGLRLCLLSSDMQNRRILDRHFTEDGGPLVHPALEANSVFTLTALVRTGMWSTVLPNGFVPLLAGADGISVIPLGGSMPAYTMGLVVPDREPLAPIVATLMEVVPTLDWTGPHPA